MRPHMLSSSLLVFLGFVSGKKQLRRKPLSVKLSKNEDSLAKIIEQTPWHYSLNAATSGGKARNRCKTPAAMLDYIEDLVDDMGETVFLELTEAGIFEAATYIKALIDNTEGDEYIGKKGKLSKEHKHYHSGIKNFWESTNDVRFSKTLLLGMHGFELSPEDDYFKQLVQYSNPDASQREVEESTDYWQKYIEKTIGYSHPLLTFNAVAVSWADTEYEKYAPDRIIIGDGLLQFVEKAGLGRAGRAYVHAHEFGHHIQFDLGVEGILPTDSPGASRRDELMADSLAAYYLSSKKGQDLDLASICKVYDAAVAVGDCQFESEGHHGTPSQRECAAMWGAMLADNAPDNVVMDPSDFIREFDDNLGKILALDSEVCPESDVCEFLPSSQSVVHDEIAMTAAEVLKELLEKINGND